MADSDLKTVDQLVAELIGTGTMNEESVAELNGYAAAAAAGTLEADDLDYLRAFHARIMDTPLSDMASTETLPVEDLRAELNEALARAERAEAEVVRLTELLGAQH